MYDHLVDGVAIERSIQAERLLRRLCTLLQSPLGPALTYLATSFILWLATLDQSEVLKNPSTIVVNETPTPHRPKNASQQQLQEPPEAAAPTSNLFATVRTKWLRKLLVVHFLEKGSTQNASWEREHSNSKDRNKPCKRLP